VKLISFKNSVDFLPSSAPRPWMKRLFAWMCVNDELRAYATHGIVTAQSPLFAILTSMDGYDPLGPMADRDELIKRYYNSELSSKMIGRRYDELIDDDPIEWSIADEPIMSSAGTILYSNNIDWELSTLDGEYVESMISQNETLFWDRDELYVSGFHGASYHAQLGGLSFAADSIELLHPIREGLTPTLPRTTNASGLGRPRKWDWEGAMAALVAVAQHPDGLPTGPGAQAKVEKMTADWFAKEAGDTPAPSQIRQHISALLRGLKRADV
jgi:hypothetical protein